MTAQELIRSRVSDILDRAKARRFAADVDVALAFNDPTGPVQPVRDELAVRRDRNKP